MDKKDFVVKEVEEKDFVKEEDFVEEEGFLDQRNV